MWHLLAEGGTVGREHEAPPASVAHPDKRHVCISLATTVPLIFTSYSSLHSDISRAATSKQKTVCRKYLSLIFRQWRTQELFSGGGSTNSVEDRGQRGRGSGGGSPLVRGSGGSCNLVQEISFHIVKFS